MPVPRVLLYLLICQMGIRYVSIEQAIQFSICKISDILAVDLHFLGLFWSASIPTCTKHKDIQSADSIHAIHLFTSGLFTVNAIWTY